MTLSSVAGSYTRQVPIDSSNIGQTIRRDECSASAATLRRIRCNKSSDNKMIAYVYTRAGCPLNNPAFVAGRLVKWQRHKT